MNPGCLTAMACACCVVVSLDSWGDEIIAPSFEPTAKTVGAGTETQDARVLVSGENVLRKTGAGTWQLPLSYLVQPWTAAFAVDEGALEFLSGADAGSYVAPTTLPASITDKALLWVDATDTDHIVGEGTAVSTWYDRREPATVTAPTYCRASAYAYSGSTAPKPQLMTMDDGQPGVYFGGRGSGTAMEWLLPNGTRYRGTETRVRAYHVFLVHNLLTASSKGTFCGTFSDLPTPFLRGSNGIGYFESESTWPAMANGRTYLNGERFDGTLKSQLGLQLLEMIPYRNVQCETSGFFNTKAATGAGGDYICEALVFTNGLTEVERLQVEEYLMAKWLPDLSVRQTPVKVGARGSLAVSGSISPNAPVRGDGVLVDGGSDPFVYEQADATAFNGTLTLGSSRSALLRSPVALTVSAGQNVSVANVDAGPTVTVTDEASDTLVKSGDDHLKIHGLPSGVKTLKVTGGSLAIETPYDAADEDIYTEIPIEDGSFEDFAADIAATKPAGDGTWSLISLTNGWNYRWNNAGSVKVIDFERWTGNGSSMDSTTRSNWNIYSHPPAGKCALVLRCGNPNAGANDAIAVSAPFHLKAGVHELRFWMCGRQGSSYIGQRFQIRLIAGSSSTEKAFFGELMFTELNDYVWMRLRTTVADEGDYRFEFRSLDTCTGLIVLDDIRLYAVQESVITAGRWKIPGGDFETASIPKGSDAQQKFSADYTHPNWTFTQGPDWTSDKLAQVGVSTIAMNHEGSGHGKGVLYNASRIPATGSIELCFSGPDTEAKTEFTPPAGTWFLQGDAARFGSHGCWPMVTAYVTVGDGEEACLGAIEPVSRLMGPMTWPTAFAADGTQKVTLRLVASRNVSASSTARNGALLDDLVLTKLPESTLGTELSKCGDCDGTGDGSAIKAVKATDVGGESGTVRTRPPSESTAAFGTTVVKGKYFITVENLSVIYEDVALPSAGTYRYTFYVHSRLNDKTGTYRHNPLRFWVEKKDSGVTNVIGQVDCYNSDWVQRFFDFTVDEAGTYRLALQGCDNPTAESKHFHEAHVDAISVKQIVRGKRGEEATFDPDLKIRVAAGAKLKVDFSGTNHVDSIRLGGHSVRGVIDVADYPEFFEGTGVFETEPAPGMGLLIK